MIEEDIASKRYGTPADFVYVHDENGNIAAMNYSDSRLDANFTHNNDGLITHATFVNPNGNEAYLTHYYNDNMQRIRTEVGRIFPWPTDFPPEAHYEYQYDERGNNTVETEYLPSGEIMGQKTFEYAPSDRRTVNLRLRELLYFLSWPI